MSEDNEILESMVEVELYIKYQCYSQAETLLEDILEKSPNYLPAKEALQTIHRKKGNLERANEIGREISLIKAQIAGERSGSKTCDLDGDPQQKRRFVERIDAIIKDIYDSNSLPEILKVASTHLIENLRADRCLILTQDRGTGQAKTHEFCKRDVSSCLDPMLNRLNQLLLKEVSGSFDPVAIDETLKDPLLVECRAFLEQHKIYSVLAHPLAYKSILIGFLLIHRCTRSVQWSEQENTLFSTVAGHLAVALGNAEHFNEIQTMAFTDKLTGIYNRRFLEERLSAELRNARQQKYPLSLAILDVDHFKKVNDTFGHATGDKVLQKLGYLLKTRVRKGDMVARFGGEEFAIILPNTQLQTAHHVLEKIRQMIESSISVTADQPITISAGIVEAPLKDARALSDIQGEMFQKADENLYRAKRSGRNSVCSGSEEDAPIKDNSK